MCETSNLFSCVDHRVIALKMHMQDVEYMSSWGCPRLKIILIKYFCENVFQIIFWKP